MRNELIYQNNAGHIYSTHKLFKDGCNLKLQSRVLSADIAHITNCSQYVQYLLGNTSTVYMFNNDISCQINTEICTKTPVKYYYALALLCFLNKL